MENGIEFPLKAMRIQGIGTVDGIDLEDGREGILDAFEEGEAVGLVEVFIEDTKVDEGMVDEEHVSAGTDGVGEGGVMRRRFLEAFGSQGTEICIFGIEFGQDGDSFSDTGVEDQIRIPIHCSIRQKSQ